MPFEPCSAARPNWNYANGKVNSRSYMPKKYRDWRIETQNWFENWLEERDYKPMIDLMYIDAEHKKPIKKNGRWEIDFFGYIVQLMFVLPANKSIGSQRLFPVARNVGDLDNFSKAVIDTVFLSESFKKAGIDDSLIQSLEARKRYALEGEESHIEVLIKTYSTDRGFD